MWMRTLKIGLPIAMKHTPDYEHTGRADLYQPIAYPKPDGVISFDRLTSVAFSYTNHAEDQPCHLKVADMVLQKASELGVYAGPSARYCPAGVYEWLEIGRASCRERVCQYVSISVVAVSVKKKNMYNNIDSESTDIR